VLGAKLEGTVLRLPGFYGPHVEKSLVHGLFTAAVAGRRAPLIAPIDGPQELVFVPDLGPVLLDVARAPAAAGHAFNLGGARVTTERELAALAFAATGHRARTLAVGPLMLRAAGLFNPLFRELVEMHYLHTTPVIVDDSALRRLLPNVVKTPYEEGVQQCIDALTAGARHETHRAPAPRGPRAESPRAAAPR
jgi:nucleoside-diphosphate-sugar epimerase